MDTTKMLLCTYVSQVLVVRIFGGIRLEHVLRKICDRWDNLCIGSFSLSYVLDGSDCKLDNEESFDNMLYLYPTTDRIHAKVEEIKSCSGRTVGSISSGGTLGSISSRVEVGSSSGAVTIIEREEPLEEFCRHAETRFLTAGWANLIHEVGQVFIGGVRDFRRSLQRYAIENGFMYDLVKNDKYRVTAKCSISSCGWCVHAILDRSSKQFWIKKLVNEHGCGSTYRTNKHKRVTSSLVASEVTSMVQKKNNTSPTDLLDLFLDKYGLDLSYHHAWLGVEKARGEIFGDYESSFDKLRWYVEAAKIANPGSLLKLEVDPVSKEFSRFFVSFNACITGFNHCRPFLCLDGTHLKGRFKGCLLAATGKDADQENDCNWLWFLRILKTILSTRPITFISDRNHGLVSNIPAVFPDCHHAYCLYHLQFNLKDHFPGRFWQGYRNRLVKLFNAIAYAPSVSAYMICEAEFYEHGGDKAKTFIASVPKQHWTNAYFQGHRYGEMSSSAIESFNNWILAARLMPIRNLVEELRSKIMIQMSCRREEASRWVSQICPDMDAKLAKRIDKGRSWRIYKSKTGLYEVKSVPAVLVNLKEGTCSCGAWQYNGFLCAHAATVLVKTCGAEGSLAGYIDPFYHVEAYRLTYQDNIHPVLAMDIPDFTEGSTRVIKAPKNRRQAGRPCVKRIRSRGEEQSSARPMKCARCHKLSHHNRRTCKEATDD
ncbi:hypothetical protein RHMOL_Rhmol04G0313600 [Rhododendron molle]|uniref:Uncharacterized protein n=1 Tax=Rhododendron molle TaxID=49168 RepID=A0ACC0P8U4_RHOML|nr:hypothetical protein RHMOL_Rhmol04G0313600 [Rhododendron molle]